MLALRALLIGSALVATVASAATFTPVGLRPGLWHVVVQMTGTMPIPAEALARMPEAQRQKMVAEMHKPLDTKQCLTAEQLAKGFDLGTHSQHCTRNMIASTGSGFSMHMDCKSERGTLISGTFQLGVIDATHFRGSTAMTMTMQGKTNNLGSTVAGEWVSADCGNVKPNEPQ